MALAASCHFLKIMGMVAIIGRFLKSARAIHIVTEHDAVAKTGYIMGYHLKKLLPSHYSNKNGVVAQSNGVISYFRTGHEIRDSSGFSAITHEPCKPTPSCLVGIPVTLFTPKAYLSRRTLQSIVDVHARGVWVRLLFKSL